MNLEKAKKKFSELFDKLIDKTKVTKEQEAISMLLFLSGYKSGYEDGYNDKNSPEILA